MVALAGRVHGGKGKYRSIATHNHHVGLIYRQSNGNCLFRAERMVGSGGATTLEKASVKSNRTRRCCWQCRAAASLWHVMQMCCHI